MKIRLDFCDFWPGFCKTRNFFYKLLTERFEVEICDGPDFLIYADPGQHAHRIHNCVKIYWGQETYLPDFRECDYAFTTHYLDDPRHARLPYYVVGTNPAQLIRGGEDYAAIMAAKTHFCSFIVRNVHPTKTKKRIDFFHKLSRYKKVDSAGKALNNVGFTIPPGADQKIKFLESYKFNIAFENAELAGWTTEKLVEPLAAHCLPIYWGNPRVAEEFNPRAFLNLPDFPSEEALIEKIIELDRDDAKYLEYLRQPCYHDNTPNPWFDRNRLLDQFEKIFTTRIRPVSQRRSWFQLGRWIAVKKSRGPEFRP